MIFSLQPFPRQRQSGTTLIEIMIYFTLLAVFLAAAFTFALQILSTSSVSNNLHELNSNADVITHHLISTIQDADSINVAQSTLDSDAGLLSLSMSDAGESPTIFSLSNGDLFLTIGAATPVQLNTPSVSLSVLRFHRIAYPKSPDQIIIDGTLIMDNVDVEMLEKDLSFHLAISLRGF